MLGFLKKNKPKSELILTDAWGSYNEELYENEIIEKEKYLEKKVLGNAFLNIDQYCNQVDSISFLFTKENILKNIISFIQNEYNKSEHNETIIILLDVLKGILENSKDLEKAQVNYN